jgi:hypothetical protein
MAQSRSRGDGPAAESDGQVVTDHPKDWAEAYTQGQDPLAAADQAWAEHDRKKLFISDKPADRGFDNSEIEALKRFTKINREALRNGAQHHEPPAPNDHVRAEPLKFTLARDITLEPKLFLIDGFLGQHEQSVWFEPPDSGKSTVVIDVSGHVAAGLEYCGRAVTQGAVLYLACERGAVVKRRIKAWCIEHGLPDIPLAVVDDAIDLRTNKVDANRVIAAAKQLAERTGLPVVLIVVDTMNRALAGGDENGPKDMGALIASVDTIYRATNAHCAMVHHTPADRTDRMRGHGSMAAAVDMTVSITRPTGPVVVAVEKGNDVVEKPEFRFEFKSVALPVEPETTAPVMVPIANDIAKPSAKAKLTKPAKTALRALIEALEKHGESAPASENIPAGIMVTTERHWRQLCYRMGISSGEDRAKQKAFKAAHDALVGDQVVGTYDGFYWLAR